jgi:predicted MFS family arabinose efflux permease
MVRALVPVESLPSAVATNSIMWNMARFVGPALAGFIIAQYGVAWAFLLNAISYSAFIFALFSLNLPPRPISTRAKASLLADMREGVAYVSRHPGLGPVLLLLIINAITVRPYVELLPGFADAVFGAGVDGFVALTAAIGIGAIVAGIWIGGREGFEGLTRFAIDGVLLMAAAVLVFAATESVWVGLFGAALSGVAMVISGVAMQSLIQQAADPDKLSRVLSLYGLSFRAGPAAGALIMGGASEIFGLQAPVVAGALICLIGWAWARKRMVAIDAALNARRE